ncbi:hypothetical protein BDF21DRAFT_495116 [Thamnidium elegans]|nr:hypothetical protein BDF21DRAFT_495116 [Thamnidium elegans]
MSQQQNTLPTFVKQLLLLVLPKSQPQQQTTTAAAISPFEKMYFSFPALEEDVIDTSSLYANK